jgi:hypothetical protein
MACDEKNSDLLRSPDYFDGLGKRRIPGPQSDCLACIEERVHSKDEERIYHPYAKHGYTPETGWTLPELPEIDRYGGFRKK